MRECGGSSVSSPPHPIADKEVAMGTGRNVQRIHARQSGAYRQVRVWELRREFIYRARALNALAVRHYLGSPRAEDAQQSHRGHRSM